MSLPEPPKNLAASNADPLLGRWAVAVILAGTLVTFFAGATSDVVKGDEGYHLGFARSWAEAGLAHRPLFNPLYASGQPPGYYYSGEILWSFGLAAIWHFTDTPAYHSWIAQAYQALWYALLLAAVYLAGCQIAGRRYGLAALCLAAAVPMFTAFSVLLYIDVPATALAALALLFLLRRHWFWAGLAMGLAYLTKRDAFFLAVPFTPWIFVEAGRAAAGSLWRRRLTAAASTALFLGPVVLIVVLDSLWRQSLLPAAAGPGWTIDTIKARFGPLQALTHASAAQLLVCGLILALLASAALYLLRRARRAGDAALVGAWALVLALPLAALLLLKAHRDLLFSHQQLDSSLACPHCLAKYLGLLPVLVIIYLVRRSWRGAGRPDAWLAISLVLYAAIAVVIFTLDTDIRYFMPAIPLAVLLLARALHGWLDRRRLLAALALAAVALAAATALFVRSERLLTPSEKAVFRYLWVVTPPHSLVLYPGEVLLVKAHRPVVWAHILEAPGGSENLPKLLLRDDPAEIIDNLRSNGINYVCLDRAHTYDDRAIAEIGGYPLSFVNKLHQAPGLEKLSGAWGDDIELFRVLPADANTPLP